VRWYRKAADAGDLLAVINLRIALEHRGAGASR